MYSVPLLSFLPVWMLTIFVEKNINEFTYLFISCPHFRGHGTSKKLHHFSLCLSSSFFLTRVPHAQTISRSSHTSWCWNSSARFTFFLHLPHGTSIWLHCLTWVLASSRGNSSWHQRHSPFSRFSMLHAKRFLQNNDTEILHFWQTLSFPVVLKHSTQNPQKLWPHGVAISASRTGFLLDIWRNQIKNLLKRWYTSHDYNCFLCYTYQTSHKYWTGRSSRKLTWSNTFFDGESIMEATLYKAGLLLITILRVNLISLRDKGYRPIHVALS